MPADDEGTNGVTHVTEERTEPPNLVDGGFEAYVAARGAALVRLAVVLTGDRHRAQDIVQDVLAKAYLKWDRVVGVEMPDIYIRRMVINASHSWWRRPANRELPIDTPPADVPGGDDPGVRLAERDLMWRHICALPARQRAVLTLRYYEDLDDETIGRILDCSPVTVRIHAMRALSTLRDRYPTGEEQ